MREETPYGYYEELDLSLSRDATKWVTRGSTERAVVGGLELIVQPERDTGLHEFLVEWTGTKTGSGDLVLQMELTSSSESSQEVKVSVGEIKLDGLKAEEVLKRLQTSRSFLFHSSTDYRHPYARRHVLRDISGEYVEHLGKAKQTVDKVLKRIARDQQAGIEDLLGRLSAKYKVAISWPSFDLTYFPYDLTLGDRKVGIELEAWGEWHAKSHDDLANAFPGQADC